MVAEQYRGARRWSRNQQAVAIVLWVSFLASAVATMVFFALFDPVAVWESASDSRSIGREAGYALGFFSFWLFALLVAGTSAWLVRTAPRREP